MTNKSTEDHLSELHRTGSLVHYSPDLWPDRSCKRRLWLHPKVHAWANAPDEGAEYGARIRAVFRSFVGGADFDDDALFKPITKGPDGKLGLWEIKIIYVPQARVFGGFLRKGEFVALSYGIRSHLASYGFQPIIDLVRQRWEDLFPDRSMLKAPRVELLGDFDGGI
ncbi:hypothetical protein YH63_020785 [Afipia massiliensis]|uniref:Uncharacterized protein n=1 Tax=Afipia massiliensis TaxID=211460 RepID=A0A4V6BFK5_9BRAD|nr:hypothetical protein [Afipia massiliensis]TKT73663.1 hypothetical protein YH63_020785 [Afipia massiliensis]